MYDQATSLASNAVDYVKQTAGIAQDKAAEAKDKAASEADNATGGQTLGGLVNQARDLTGDALGTVKRSVA